MDTADRRHVDTGTRYQVGPQLARRRIDVYFDPEAMGEVEIHHGGQFVERCAPFEVREHRRPKPKRERPSATTEAEAPATADWLAQLTDKRRQESPAVFDEPAVRDFPHHYGPFDPVQAGYVVADLIAAQQRADHHVDLYLEAIREAGR